MLDAERFIQERIFLHNVTPATVEWYRQSFAWLEKFALTEDGLKQFVMEMRKAGLQPISCNNRIRCANAYLAWSGSPLRVPKVKDEPKILPTFTEEQLKKIISYRPKKHELKLHVLLLTLIDTGLRITEALCLSPTDVDLDQMLLSVKGKGGKEAHVAFSVELRKALWKYSNTIPKDSKFLFSTRDGKKLGRRNVLRAFKRHCRNLGFEPARRSLHALRHTFALNYLRSGGSVFHLQKALRHSSLEQTRKYANLMTEDLQKTQHQVSLLNRLR